MPHLVSGSFSARSCRDAARACARARVAGLGRRDRSGQSAHMCRFRFRPGPRVHDGDAGGVKTAPRVGGGQQFPGLGHECGLLEYARRVGRDGGDSVLVLCPQLERLSAGAHHLVALQRVLCAVSDGHQQRVLADLQGD